MRQTPPNREASHLIAWLATMWCIALFLPALTRGEAGPSGSLGEGLANFFGRICHQDQERSLRIFGNPLAVCFRCMSIYLGFFTGTLIGIGTRFRHADIFGSRIVVVIALLPMLADVIAGILGIYDSNVLRIATGGWFGLIIAWSILPPSLSGVTVLLNKTRLFPGGSNP